MLIVSTCYRKRLVITSMGTSTTTLFSNCGHVFTVLHGMQTWSSDENLSVCLSNVWFVTKRKLCPHSYTTSKTIYHSVVTRSMVDGGDTFYLKFRVKLIARSEIANFQWIFTRSVSAVTASEKSSINYRMFTTCFPMNLWWSLYVA